MTARQSLDQIVRGLDGVTDGPWVATKKFEIGPRSSEDDQSNGMVIPLADVFGENREADAGHIARCSPDTMREIAAYVRETEARATAAEATVTALQEALDNYEEILRCVCHHLELPQSESGPADDLRLYDRALEEADLYTRQADKDLAENKDLRFKAEAEAHRLREALKPFADEADRIHPDWDSARRRASLTPSKELTVGDFRRARTALTTIRRTEK